MKRLIIHFVLRFAVLGVWVGPCSAQGRAALILVPGAGGATPNDFLIRNRGGFSSRGLETSVALSVAEVVSAANAIRARGGKPVLVAMSKGTLTAAHAIAGGAPVAGVVFVSGFMAPGQSGSVPSILGSPGKLPPTLVVHHRQDACPLTPPSGAAAFGGWSGGKASVHWVTGGNSGGAPCRPMSAHGYLGQDSDAVSAIASFASAR